METTEKINTQNGDHLVGHTSTTGKASRFDYVAYDEQAALNQQAFKSMCTELETHINSSILCPRSKALALTNLEETYMWIGKGIRNDQILRNGSAPLQETRNNS